MDMAIDDGRAAGGGPAAPLRFSASGAAFTGLDLLTREPRTWLIWAALALALSLASGALTVAAAGPGMLELAAGETSPADPAAAFAALSRLAPLYALTSAGSLVVYAVACAGVNRAVLRPAPAGLAHLALGGDELRQFIVLVLLGLVLLGVYIASLIAGALLSLGLGALRAAPAAAAGGGLRVLVVALVFAVVLGPAAFVMTRLSLTAPIALDTGRIDLGASWRMTRGRFWALFGSYVLAWLVTAVIFIAVGVVFTVAAVTAGGGLKAVDGLFRPDASSLEAYFGPLQLLWTIVNAALAPVLFALGIGAPAGAYAQLRGLSAPAAPGPTAQASDLPRFGR